MRLLQSSLSVFLTHILLQVISILPSVLISRRFGPEGKGLMALWLYVPALLCALSSLGMASAAQYFVSRKEDSPAEQLGNILLLPLVTSALLILGFYLTYSWWQPYLENLSFGRMLPALLILPASLIQSHCSQLLVALDHVPQRNKVLILQTTTSAILIAALMLLPQLSIDAALWGYIVGFALGAALALYFCVAAAGGLRLPSRNLSLRSLSYGFWIYISALIRLLAARVSFFLLIAFATIGDAGIFSVCQTITSPLVTLPWAVQTVLFPVSAAQSDEEARRHTPRYLRQLLIVLMMLAVALVLLSEPILAIFGPEFVSGQTALIILLVAILFAGQNTVLSTYIQARGRPALTTVATLVFLIVSIALSFWLIPSLGLIGGALATAGGRFAFTLVSVVIYLKLAQTSMSELYRFRRSDLAIFGQIVGILRAFLRRR